MLHLSVSGYICAVHLHPEYVYTASMMRMLYFKMSLTEHLYELQYHHPTHPRILGRSPTQEDKSQGMASKEALS